jgi:thiol-disulfide isomerase/thioredoxin
MKSLRCYFIFLTIAGVIANGCAQSVTIGSTAPPLKVEKWLKSSPILGFQRGKIYVVEFWATWCPPCKESIPHLTRLAKKFSGKVIFAGISIAEEQKSDSDLSYVGVVRKFVQGQGPKMDYHVAVDRPDHTMASSWMDAAGENGIPTAFVVDGTGKVAWIGPPMRGLENVLDQEVSGKYDLRSASKEHSKKKTENAALADPQANGSMAALATAIENKDWKSAAKTCDVIFASDRSQEKIFGPIKFLALLQTDETAAYSYARRLSTGLFKTSPVQLTSLSQMILSDQYGPKKPNTAFALELANQAVLLTHEQDPDALDTLANAQFKSNDFDSALSSDNKAMKLLDTTTLYPPSTIENIRSSIIKHLSLIQAKRALIG